MLTVLLVKKCCRKSSLARFLFSFKESLFVRPCVEYFKNVEYFTEDSL